jgi:hypothetical protein
MTRNAYRILLLIILLAFAASAWAQTAPEYLVRNLRPDPNAAPGSVGVAFEIENAGSDAAVQGTVRLVVAATGGEIGAQTIPPLRSGEFRTFTFAIPTAAYQPGQRVSFGVLIDLPGVPPPAGGGQFDGMIGVVMPASAAPQPDVSGTGAGSGTPASLTILGLDLLNPVNAALVLGAFGLLLIVIWMLSLLARALFVPPPTFPPWQPPYTINPMIDPNSIAGRRQLWQQHAQSDALTLPCALNSYMVRKLPIGIDGKKLSGWTISAVRLSQYDMYGRVDRSETILDRSTTRRVDRAVRRGISANLDARQLERLARPLAKRMINALMRRTRRRSLMLPIALDIRLLGTQHDGPEVLFELHRCVGSGWEMIDRWETDLYANSGQVIENFTYTLFGQQSGEPFKAFRARLERDLTALLAGMLYQPPLQDTVNLESLEPVDFAALAETISFPVSDLPPDTPSSGTPRGVAPTQPTMQPVAPAAGGTQPSAPVTIPTAPPTLPTDTAPHGEPPRT